MRIKTIEIKRFRSIKQSKIEIDKITGIVGENNAGKTAVLRALNAFFNFDLEKEYFINKIHKYGPKANTYIDVEFEVISQLPSSFASAVYNNTIKLRFVYNYNENRDEYFIYRDSKPHRLINDEWSKLISKIDYVYIPVERNHIKDQNNIFDTLVKNYIEKYTSNRDTISTHVRNAANTLHNNILSKLEKNIKELYFFGENNGFKIDAPSRIDYRILLDSLEMSLVSENGEFPLEEYGSGTKSLATIAMYRTNAKLQGKSVILGIEEPETNLHPQAQKKLISKLKNSVGTEEVQTIFTTHSTVLIDQLKHEEIVLARRERDPSARVKTELTQIGNKFWENPEIEEFKHYQYFHYKNSDFFFSKYVVVCESKNDSQVIEKIVRDKIGSSVLEISFLDAGGKENIKYAYYLLKALNIPSSFVVDKDFFFDYLNNNNLEESRDIKTGLPQYDFSKISSNNLLEEIFGPKIRNILNQSSYRKLFSIISERNILSMNYCLEMDLTCSKRARSRYFEILNIPTREQTQKELLVKKNAIKKIGNIMKVLDTLTDRQLPESYQKIRNFIVKDSKKYL
ncbi:ATP-dependent nuclease [Streptococcus pluranimalium]|uniref:ATP-dependent nuclease n=1 Tax=Streptococcus pluranimalium TaxID=82348 RepID=UPI003F68C586